MCGSPFNLQIHHVKPRSRFRKGDKNRDSEDNLILLCAKCHDLVHSGRVEIIKDGNKIKFRRVK